MFLILGVLSAPRKEFDQRPRAFFVYWESNLNSQPYSDELVIPSEITFWDANYTVAGIRNGALAATFSSPCDITRVDLPSTIVQVGQSAFSGCASLKRITVHATTTPNAFDLFMEGYDQDSYGYYNSIGCSEAQLYDQVTLFVPNESLEAYRAHEEWGKFTHIVPFIGDGPGDINGDGNIAISDATELVDMLLNGEELPAWADVNGDGKVTVADVADLIDLLMNND